MEVRQGEDRRVGSDAEKLLTLEEAARVFGGSPDDVESLVRRGELAAFRLGGNLLRLKRSDVEAAARRRAQAKAVAPSAPPAPPKPKAPQPPPLKISPDRGPFWNQVSDFLYFNDFYLVALLIILTLVAIIFAL